MTWLIKSLNQANISGKRLRLLRAAGGGQIGQKDQAKRTGIKAKRRL